MTVVEKQGRNHRAYRAKTAKLRKRADTCWICGKWIDRSLDYRHPMSWTADHVTPLTKGGKLLGEMRPAHRSCNSRRGNRVPERPQLPTSRDW